MIGPMLRKAAFDYPYAVWGLGLGLAGPALVFVTPPIRRALGIAMPKPVPESYPLPNRARRATTGYED